jgi:hypothetical protein
MLSPFLFLEDEWNCQPAQAGDIGHGHAKQGCVVDAAEFVHHMSPREGIAGRIVQGQAVFAVHKGWDEDEFHREAPREFPGAQEDVDGRPACAEVLAPPAAEAERNQSRRGGDAQPGRTNEGGAVLSAQGIEFGDSERGKVTSELPEGEGVVFHVIHLVRLMSA